MSSPTRYQFVRDRRGWDASLVALDPDADGNLLLARVPGPADGVAVTLPLPEPPRRLRHRRRPMRRGVCRRYRRQPRRVPGQAVRREGRAALSPAAARARRRRRRAVGRRQRQRAGPSLRFPDAGAEPRPRRRPRAAHRRRLRRRRPRLRARQRLANRPALRPARQRGPGLRRGTRRLRQARGAAVPRARSGRRSARLGRHGERGARLRRSGPEPTISPTPPGGWQPGAAVAGAGRVYVADRAAGRIHVFREDGSWWCALPDFQGPVTALALDPATGDLADQDRAGRHLSCAFRRASPSPPKAISPAARSTLASSSNGSAPPVPYIFPAPHRCSSRWRNPRHPRHPRRATGCARPHPTRCLPAFCRRGRRRTRGAISGCARPRRRPIRASRRRCADCEPRRVARTIAPICRKSTRARTSPRCSSSACSRWHAPSSVRSRSTSTHPAAPLASFRTGLAARLAGRVARARPAAHRDGRRTPLAH